MTGYEEQNFFTLNSKTISDILKSEDIEHVVDFISAFSFAKGQMVQKYECVSSLEIEETESSKFIHNSSSTNLHEKTLSSVPTSNENTSEGSCEQLPIFFSTKNYFICNKITFNNVLFFIYRNKHKKRSILFTEFNLAWQNCSWEVQERKKVRQNKIKASYFLEQTG